MNHQPIQGKPNQRTRWWPRVELAKRDARIEALHDRMAESGTRLVEVLAQNTRVLEDATRTLQIVNARFAEQPR